MDYRKQKIEYVRYYSAGSEAYKLEPNQPVRNQSAKKKAHKAAPRPAEIRQLSIDPLALVAICLTVVMVVLMFVGYTRLQEAQAQLQQMENHIQYLENEKQELTAYFESGYDLEAVRKAALSLGMVPIESVDHYKVLMDPLPQ